MKQYFIVKLVVWLGWLSHFALAQLELSGAITGSVSFPHVAITCIGNLAAFITSLLRRRFDLEMGARDFIATIGDPGKLKKIEEKGELIGFHTCQNSTYTNASVVMLTSTTGMSNSSIKKFMKYIDHAQNVKSILLEYDPLKDAPVLKQDPIIQCNSQHYCNCIVFPIVGKSSFTLNIARQMPRALKELSDYSLYLLPCLRCQDSGCHGCQHDLLHVEKELTSNETEKKPELIKDADFDEKFPAAVCDALDFDLASETQKEPICICIPVNPVSDDDWTKLLVRCFKSKEEEDKGATLMASDALQSYLDKKKEERTEEVLYRPVSLILPRIVEISINLLLTVLFKVDGFSSSLAARRAVRSYVVDSKATGLPANVFLTRAQVFVKSNSVCQVLKFRGNILGTRTLLFIVGFVNLACSITWAVVIALGRSGKWYEITSMAPSKPRVAVIIAAIGIVIIGLDYSDQCFRASKYSKNLSDEDKKCRMIKRSIVLVVIVIEMVLAIVAGAFGLNNGIGRWIYAALQGLVWVKWIVGSYLLGLYSPEYIPISAQRKQADFNGHSTLDFSPNNWDYSGTLVYSSAFLLNAVLAGVRGNWAGVWDSWK